MKWKEFLPKKIDLDTLPIDSDALTFAKIINMTIDDCIKSLEGKILSVDSVSVEEIQKIVEDYFNQTELDPECCDLAVAIKSLLERKARE